MGQDHSLEPGSHGFDVPKESTVVKKMGQRVEKDSAEAGGSLCWRSAWSTLGVLGETLTQRKINNNKKEAGLPGGGGGVCTWEAGT